VDEKSLVFAIRKVCWGIVNKLQDPGLRRLPQHVTTSRLQKPVDFILSWINVAGPARGPLRT
jgi:hypothetical protein